MGNGFLGIIGLIAALLGGRYINERGMQKLDEKSHSTLIAGLSRYRIASIIGVAVIVGGYFITASQLPDQSVAGSPLFISFTVVLVLYMLLGTAFVYFKMKRLAIPEDYVNTYLLSTVIQYLGLIFYFGVTRF